MKNKKLKIIMNKTINKMMQNNNKMKKMIMMKEMMLIIKRYAYNK